MVTATEHDGDGLNLQSIIDLAYADNGRETSRAHGNGLSTTRSYTRDDNLVTSITCGTSLELVPKNWARV
jgi:hypothetical protein